MDRKTALMAKDRSLEAIRLLHSILGDENKWDELQYHEIKRGIGLSIGRIEVDLLGPVYKKFPDLDDLA
jgi:hypothetical protein